MDLALTEEQTLIQRTARELLEARSPFAHVREMARDPVGYSRELWQELADLGWMGLALPEAHGGLGQGFLELCLLIEELGRHQTPLPFVGNVCAALAIARHGSDAQKTQFLGRLAAGEEIMACGGGALATLAKDGGYVLDGEMMFVPYAHVADHFLVSAQKAGAGEPIVCIVDGADAVSEPLETIRPDHEHRVRLDALGVGREQVIGLAQGTAVAQDMERHATAAACAEMVGGAQRVLDLALGYVREREQFGRPVGSFQAVQHHLANMATDILGARLIAYEAIWHLSAGHEALEEVAAAKAWVSEAYRRVCAVGHQVHGAIGFTEEYPLHHYLRHAISAEVTFGDAEHHLERVARSLGL